MQDGTSLVPMPSAIQPIGGGDIVAQSISAQAVAAVQARHIIAINRPRDENDVRVRLLKECDRPSFAETARYKVPRGNATVDGFSIRFAEAALRCMGNVLQESIVVFEDEEKRSVRVLVTDLENNTTYQRDVLVSKTIERKKLKQGEQPLGQRKNSVGETVYKLPATDDDLLQKEGALVSKAIRSIGLRLIPGDLLDECEQRLIATSRKSIKEDPDAERKRLCDAFSTINVMPAALAEFLGHTVETISPQELTDLRRVFTAIKDGEISWNDVLRERAEQLAASEGSGKPKTRAEKLSEMLESAQSEPEVASEEVEQGGDKGEGGPNENRPSEERFEGALLKAKTFLKSVKAENPSSTINSTVAKMLKDYGKTDFESLDETQKEEFLSRFDRAVENWIKASKK